MKLVRLIAVAVLVALQLQGEEADSITRGRVVEEINEYRARHRLAPLRADERLHRAAEDRIEEMSKEGYWGHEPPGGGSTFVVCLRRQSYHHRIAGENLAAGYETATVLVESWMESPGHRSNILSPSFDDIGVAWIEGGVTSRRAGRSVVVLFAREAEPEPPKHSSD